MDYENFKEMVQDRIKSCLPEDYGNARVDVKRVYKVNQVKDSLVIIPEGKNISLPNIYISNLYEGYKKCGSFEMVMRAVSDSIQRHGSLIQEEVPELDKDSIKDNAVMCLVNTAQNMEMLQNVPHRPFHDLSVIYRFIASQGSGGISSAIITNRIMEEAGLAPDKLFQYAAENTKRLFPVRVLPIQDVLSELLTGKEEDYGFAMEMLKQERTPEESIWVITNSAGINGAASVLYEENLHKLAEMTGTGLYILPSSVHEVLAVPTDMGSPEELAEMVYETNMSSVPLEERLSNNVYHYDGEIRKMSMVTGINTRSIGGEKTFPDTIKNNSRQKR
ncbi:MAG: hypothetical protein K1W06_08225 [Lachnospiraceae bacterium]